MSKVVVVGGINADVTVRVDSAAAPGETVVGDGPTWTPGGKGANMAVAVAAAGAEVSLCGAVGDDPAGIEQLDALRSGGVDVSTVAVRSDVATGVALIVVTPDGENSITVGTGANASLTSAEIAGAVADAGVVLVQAEIGVAATEQAIAATTGRVVLSLAPVVRLDDAAVAASDPLVLNEEEARMTNELHGGPDVRDATSLAEAVLSSTGCRSVVISLGAAGAVCGTPGDITHVPAVRVEVVDTTGAGDALTGALVADLARGASLLDATKAAITAAAAAVGRAGAR